MRKNITYTLLFSSMLMQPLHAQFCDLVSAQYIYYNKNIHDAHTKNLFFTPAGNIYITGYTQSALNKSVDAWIMKTTSRETPLWSRAIGTSDEEVINGVKNTLDKGFVIVGNTKSGGVYGSGWVAKVDSNGTPQWSVSLGIEYSSLSQIIQLTDGNYAAAGTLYLQFNGDGAGNITEVKRSTNIIILLDKNGNTIWWKSFYYTNKESLNTISQLRDGDLLVTGNVTDGNNAYLIKMKKENGDIIWMNEYENTTEFKFAHSVELADGTIHFSSGNKIYYFTADGKSLPGKQINLNSDNLSLDNAEAADLGKIPSGEEVFFTNLFPQPAVLFAVKDDSIVVWAHIFKGNTKNLQRLGNGKLYNNSIYLTGLYLADKLSDSGPDESLSYLIKANLEGKTLCADTCDISFSITSFPAFNNVSHNWQYEGALYPKNIEIYVEHLDPMRVIDCSVESCCRDTLQYKNDFICEGGTYKLPDGVIVDSNGNYASALNTSTGCDSVIYTNLSLKQRFNFTLGNDTCLGNSLSLNYSLPADSSVSYRWQDGSSMPVYIITMPGKYWVTAVSFCNSITDSLEVYKDCSLPVYIPSGFTPNNDGLNDIFRILDMKGQHLLSFSIYNRYGQLIFFTNDMQKGWDGSINDIKQPAGAYVYFIRYADIAGAPHQLSGTLVLIR